MAKYIEEVRDGAMFLAGARPRPSGRNNSQACLISRPVRD
jgi:hypothetical protein